MVRVSVSDSYVVFSSFFPGEGLAIVVAIQGEI